MTCFGAILLLFKYALEIEEKQQSSSDYCYNFSIKGKKKKNPTVILMSQLLIISMVISTKEEQINRKNLLCYVSMFAFYQFSPENKNHGQFLCNLCFLLFFHAYVFICIRKKFFLCYQSKKGEILQLVILQNFVSFLCTFTPCVSSNYDSFYVDMKDTKDK